VREEREISSSEAASRAKQFIGDALRHQIEGISGRSRPRSATVTSDPCGSDRLGTFIDIIHIRPRLVMPCNIDARAGLAASKTGTWLATQMPDAQALGGGAAGRHACAEAFWGFEGRPYGKDPH